jgi:hypothetical protein
LFPVSAWLSSTLMIQQPRSRQIRQQVNREFERFVIDRIDRRESFAIGIGANASSTK